MYIGTWLPAAWPRTLLLLVLQYFSIYWYGIVESFTARAIKSNAVENMIDSRQGRARRRLARVVRP